MTVAAAPPPPKLRLHDALLINLVGAILCAPITEEDVLGDHVEAIRRVLPMVSRDGLLIADLARAAAAMLEGYPERGARAADGALNRWARARFDAGVAMAAILRWRAAEVYERIYAGEATS